MVASALSRPARVAGVMIPTISSARAEPAWARCQDHLSLGVPRPEDCRQQLLLLGNHDVADRASQITGSEPVGARRRLPRHSGDPPLLGKDNGQSIGWNLAPGGNEQLPSLPGVAFR
jgi:hypothetical protein